MTALDHGGGSATDLVVLAAEEEGRLSEQQQQQDLGGGASGRVFKSAAEATSALQPNLVLCLMPPGMGAESSQSSSATTTSFKFKSLLRWSVLTLAAAVALLPARPPPSLPHAVIFIQAGAGHLGWAAGAGQDAGDASRPSGPSPAPASLRRYTSPAYAFAASLSLERTELTVRIVDMSWQILAADEPKAARYLVAELSAAAAPGAIKLLGSAYHSLGSSGNEDRVELRVCLIGREDSRRKQVVHWGSSDVVLVTGGGKGKS